MSPSLIVHIGAAETLGGVAREQIVRLQALGWPTQVATYRDGWEGPLVDRGIHVRQIRLGHRISAGEAVAALPDLLSVIRRSGAALVHTHNAEHGVLGRIAARMLGLPSVHTWRYDPLDAASGAAQRAIYAAAEATAARAGSAVLFQNREDMRRATNSRLVPRSRARFVGNGIDIERFAEPRRPREEVRAELGLAREDIAVLCVARFQARKGHRYLLEAVADLLPRHANLRLMLVGTGPDEPALRSQAADCCGSAVSFLGHRNDVPDVIHACDIACLPSEREGLPRAVLEARAAGLPVVATDVVGTREAITQDETDMLVPYADPAALAHMLERLLNEPETATRLAAQGKRRLFEEDRDEDAVVARVSDVYASLLGPGR